MSEGGEGVREGGREGGGEGGDCLGLPRVNVQGHLLQLGQTVLLRGVQNTLQIPDPVANGNCHLLSLARGLRTLVQSGSKPNTELGTPCGSTHTQS